MFTVSMFYSMTVLVFYIKARPITTLEEVTDEDLIHEFDDPLITDQEWLTTGNIRFFNICFNFLKRI